MSFKMARLVMVMALFAIVHGRKGQFTIYTNLEKLFYMETEVISLADIFIREEHFAHNGEDVHNLGGIKQLMDEVKELHRNVTSVDDYLSHPINVYHLAHRLKTEWREAVQLMYESEPCKNWEMPEMLRRMGNIMSNFPTEEELQKVAQGIAAAQFTENIDLDDIFKGVIAGRTPVKPVTVDDLIDFAIAAYKAGQFYFTTRITERVIKECKSAKIKEGCDDLRLYKVAHSSYFKLNNLEKAIAMAKKILDKDPENRGALRSKRYYENRLNSKTYTAEEIQFEATNVKYYQTCSGLRNMTAAQESRLYCTYLPLYGAFVYERIEFYSINPPIFEIYSAFTDKQCDNMKSNGIRMLERVAMSNGYRTPDYKTSLPPTHVYRTFSNRFTNLSFPLQNPLDIGTVEVRQFGLEGMYFKPQNRNKIPNLGGHVGSFFTFINDGYTGGQFVFPKHNIKITPVKGHTVFFMATKSTVNICPVAYGSQWLAVQSLFEIPKKKICRYHEEDFWGKN